MKKNIDDIIFSEAILNRYKEDALKIEQLCKKLDNNKKINKKLKRYRHSRKIHSFFNKTIKKEVE